MEEDEEEELLVDLEEGLERRRKTVRAPMESKGDRPLAEHASAPPSTKLLATATWMVGLRRACCRAGHLSRGGFGSSGTWGWGRVGDAGG